MGRRGFTLVEMLVVLVLIGIAASVAAPAMRSPDAARAAQQLAGVYRVARHQATTRGVTVAATLDLASGSYRVLALGDPSLPPETVREGALKLPAGTRLQSAGAASAVVAFEPQGLARGDRVILHSDEGNYEVAVDPWTGAALVRRF